MNVLERYLTQNSLKTELQRTVWSVRNTSEVIGIFVPNMQIASHVRLCLLELLEAIELYDVTATRTFSGTIQLSNGTVFRFFTLSNTLQDQVRGMSFSRALIYLFENSTLDTFEQEVLYRVKSENICATYSLGF